MKKDLITDLFDNIPNRNELFVNMSFLIADRIHNTIEAKGLTYAGIANDVGMSEYDFRGMLTGLYNFTLKELALLQDVLGVEFIK